MKNYNHTIESLVQMRNWNWTRILELNEVEPQDQSESLLEVCKILYTESLNCTYYRTDVLHDILKLAQHVSYTDREETFFYIGFRENGTDTIDTIEIRIQYPESFGDFTDNYFAMYRVIIDKRGIKDTVIMDRLDIE